MSSSKCRLTDEITVASDLFNGSLLTSPFSYEHALSLFCFSVFDRVRSDFDYDRLRAELANHDPPTALPDDKRNADRFLLRGRALHGRQRRRHRAATNERSWVHIIPAVLAGWLADRVHVAIRR